MNKAQRKEIKKLCYRFIACSDGIDQRRAYGMPRASLREQEERTIEAARDIRDAVTEAGV